MRPISTYARRRASPHRSSSPSALGPLRAGLKVPSACKAAPRNRMGVPNGHGPAFARFKRGLGWGHELPRPRPSGGPTDVAPRHACRWAFPPPFRDLWAGRGGSTTIEPAYVRRDGWRPPPFPKRHDAVSHNIHLCRGPGATFLVRGRVPSVGCGVWLGNPPWGCPCRSRSQVDCVAHAQVTQRVVESCACDS